MDFQKGGVGEDEITRFTVSEGQDDLIVPFSGD
jgi:hypothetical protein